MLPLADRMLLEDVFQGIQLAPETIDDIMAMLSRDATSMSTSRGNVTPVGEGSFGQSASGSFRLATNATMAHEALRDELLNMVAGLRGYRDAIRSWADDMTTVDTDAVTFNTTVESAAVCVTAPPIDSNQCTLPPEGDS